jgi:NAD-dependent dihydropyrimidine dehydrogenase PreA subunit
MGQDEYAMHYVSTHEEARKMSFLHNRFWVSNCGCRERKGHCDRSRTDICLIFKGDIGSSGSGIREIGLTDVLAIFEEAAQKHLVTRPYRNDKDPAVTDGICFCCNDCCDYLLNPLENKCDKGALIEATNMEQCNFCGDCVNVCYFQVRKMVDDELVVSQDNCYGCGLCAGICPEQAIKMIPRG